MNGIGLVGFDGAGRGDGRCPGRRRGRRARRRPEDAGIPRVGAQGLRRPAERPPDRRVPQGVGGVDGHGVVGGVDPGLAEIEHLVVIEVPTCGSGNRPAEHLVGEAHPGERHAARVRHPEGVGDRLPGVGGGRAGLHQDHGGCGSWIVIHRVVVLILDRYPGVIGRNSRHVPERERGSLRHRVRLRVGPDLVTPEHLVVPGVAARRPGDRSAKFRVGEGHVREWNVARVRDTERIGDRLTDARRRRPVFFEVDTGSDRQCHRLIGGVAHREVLVGAPCRCRVLEGICSTRWDRVRRGVGPRLGEIEDAVSIVAARRPGDVAIAAQERIVHRHL